MTVVCSATRPLEEVARIVWVEQKVKGLKMRRRKIGRLGRSRSLLAPSTGKSHMRDRKGGFEADHVSGPVSQISQSAAPVFTPGSSSLFIVPFLPLSGCSPSLLIHPALLCRHTFLHRPAQAPDSLQRT